MLPSSIQKFLCIYLFCTFQVEGLRSITKNFARPLEVGDVITIKGSGYTRSAGQIRLHSPRGSCGKERINNMMISCNPLVLKVYTRRRQIQFFKKGKENNNADVMMEARTYSSLSRDMPYEIKITVTYTGFDVKFNEEKPTSFVSEGKVEMIRAQSGNYKEIIADRGASIPLNEPWCGTRQGDIFRHKWARITNGVDAEPGAYPWQVSLRRKFTYAWAPYPHICGGSLISACWVVTAAHCVTSTAYRRKHHYEIRIGDLYNGNDTVHSADEDQQVFNIEKVFVHNEYVSVPVPRNDVALIKLKPKHGKCARYSKYVNSVCLPKPELNFPYRTECKISGWGAKNWTDSPRNYPHHLQHGSVRLQDFDECQSLYGKDDRYNVTQIAEGMLCAGSDSGVDTCQGDSGGPLVCETPGGSAWEELPFVLVGITSWGRGCADSLKPGVYAKVADFTDWIKETKANYTKELENYI